MKAKPSCFAAALDRCGSPIELSFLSALLFFGDYTFEPFTTTSAIAQDATGIVLSMQVPLEGYRIDFALTRAGAPVRLAIELDGFAHHGATPDQFARDKVRERALQGLGWTFLRFSGREVNRDPRKCVAEAMREASRVLFLAEEGGISARIPRSFDEMLARAGALEAAGDTEGARRLILEARARL